jgi:cytochrome c peroxidase
MADGNDAMRSALRAAALLLGAALATGSAAEGSKRAAGTVEDGFDWPLPAWIAPPPVPADNPMSAVKVDLGRRLFFDTRLAGLNYMACATCHRPGLAFSDGRPVAIGVTGERHVRNSPALANVAFLSSLTWADPDLASLEEQAKAPLFGRHPIEMFAPGKEDLIVARLGVDLRYRDLFAAAFPETGGRIDFIAIRKALAAFERTLLSFDAPYDRYRYGGDPDALGAAAWRGETLFTSERLGCDGCHTPPFFTDAVGRGAFHNTGLYDLDGDGGLPVGNQGLIEHTGRPKDMGRFRTPRPAQRRADGALHARRVDPDAGRGDRALRRGRPGGARGPAVAARVVACARLRDHRGRARRSARVPRSAHGRSLRGRSGPSAARAMTPRLTPRNRVRTPRGAARARRGRSRSASTRHRLRSAPG